MEDQRDLVIDERTLDSERSVLRTSTFRSSEAPNLQYGSTFRMRVIRREHESSVAVLLGELDVTSLEQFELMITEVLSSEPKELVFDLTQS